MLPKIECCCRARRVPPQPPVTDSPATSHRKVATSQSPEAQRGQKTFEAVTNRRSRDSRDGGDGGNDAAGGDSAVVALPVTVVPDGAVQPWVVAPAAAPTSTSEPAGRWLSSQGDDAPLEGVREKMAQRGRARADGYSRVVRLPNPYTTCHLYLQVREKMARLRAVIRTSNSSTHESLSAGGAPQSRGAVPSPPLPAGALGVNLDYVDMDLDDDQPGSVPRAGATPRAAAAITNQPGRLEKKQEDDLEVR